MESGLGFSIGIHTKKGKQVKKVKKRKPVFNDVYYYNTLIPAFIVYSGPRWLIPEYINVSQGLRAKFSLFETLFSFREIKLRIADHIRNMRFKFDTISANQWKPPQHIVSSITSFYAKQENEWNKVRATYFKLLKLREVLLPMIFNWQIKKCLKNCKNIEDPVTLEVPKKPVTVIDFKKRISFIYDARTLKRAIENRLLLSDYMFPEPKEPVNMLTNEPFTLGQLISVYKQCVLHGEYSWIIDSYIKLNCKVTLFEVYNKQKLKIEAINTFFKNSSFVIRDVVLDYFNLEADYIELADAIIYKFTAAYDSNPERKIIQEWIGITREYYIAKELNEPFLLTQVATKTDGIMNAIYKIFYHPSY